MEQRIKSVSEAYAREPRRVEVNTKSEFGVQKILLQMETHKNPPHPEVSRHMYIAYDKDDKIISKFQYDSVNVEYF